jgi:hypothetical protein
MAKQQLPLVPPAGRSNKGAAAGDGSAKAAETMSDPRTRNVDKQGRQGNIKVNTTNQGYQQDR